MTFFTNGSERMRIDSAGNLLVGTTSAIHSSNTIQKDSGNPVLSIVDTNSNNFGSRIGLNVRAGTYNSADSSSLLIRFQRGDGTTVGSVGRSGASAVTYSTSSDYRLKENVKPLENGLSKVQKLNPVQFDWKESGETNEGFIAHEVQEICKEAVSGKKDGEEMQGVDYGRITPLLVKAIQEQQEEIEQLKQNSHAPKTIEEMEGYEDLINRIKELENK